MKTYRRRDTVRAVQFTGNNKEECREFCKAMGYTEYMVNLYTDNIPTEYWLVETPYDTIDFLSPKQFEKAFIEID